MAAVGGFPRTARLRRAREYETVFARPDRIGDRLFLVFSRSTGRSSARLGLAISRRSAVVAAQRSRIKRLVRESFRKARGSLAAVDIVVVGRPGVGNRSNPEIFASLRRHWGRLSA